MDTLIATVIAVVSHSLFFLAGLIVAGHYHDRMNVERDRADAEKAHALQCQFLRLRANMDADDPCRPYVSKLTPIQPTGDYDGDGPITQEFMEHLKKNGSASTKISKSDSNL